ncbi:hypothetical protein ACFCT7_01585 [Fulvivirgaceae bacterium LMO-SS25]
MKQFILISFLSVFVLACGETAKESETTIESSNYTGIEIVDSIMYDYLGEAELWDVSPDGNKLLLRDWQRKEFLIINTEGELINSFIKDGDVMDNPGFLLMAASFHDNETILAGSVKGIFFFSLPGELIRKVNFTDIPEVNIFYTSAGFHFQNVELNGNNYLLGPAITPNEFTKMEQDYYKTRKSISMIDLDSGKIEGIINLEPDSRFFDGKVYEMSHVYTYFKMVDDKLWVVHAGDPRLLVYEMKEPFDKVMDIPLNLIGLNYPEGVPPQAAEPRSISMDSSIGGVKGIQIVGDKVALLYYQGMKQEVKDEIEPLWSTDQEKASELWQIAAEKVEYRVQVFDKEGNFEGDFVLPKTFRPYVFIGTEDGSLWLSKAANEEEEEDFVTFYKAKLVKD